MKTPKWFREQGCELAVNDPMGIFTPLFIQTNGDPCNGCNCKSDCKPWKLMTEISEQTQRQIASKQQYKTMKDGLTNAEIAAALGVTKRQAAKMRAEGKIDIANLRDQLAK